MRAILLSIASLFVFAGAADARSVRLDISGYDLNVAEDVDAVYAMITDAVHTVCKRSGISVYSLRRSRERCERLTMGETVAALDIPAISRRYYAEAEGAVRVATAD